MGKQQKYNYSRTNPLVIVATKTVYSPVYEIKPLHLFTAAAFAGCNTNNSGTNQHCPRHKLHQRAQRTGVVRLHLSGEAIGHTDTTGPRKPEQFHLRMARLQQNIGHLVGSDRKSTRLNSSHVRISYAVF